MVSRIKKKCMPVRKGTAPQKEHAVAPKEPAQSATPSYSIKHALQAGETEEQVNATFSLAPAMQAAGSLMSFNHGFLGEKDLTQLVGDLVDHCRRVNDGDLTHAENMLLSQAQTLDAMFNNLARRALKCDLLNQYEAHLRLALKAQSQCRTTLEALAEIKNPRAVAFVRQANIANGPQQVNNGGTANAPREESVENPPNELSRLTHEEGQRLAIEASGTAGATCPAMATVDALNRTKDAGGQNGVFTQRVERWNAADAARDSQGTEDPAA